MDDKTIADQNDLIAMLEDAGWDLCRVETSELEYTCRNQGSTTEATVKITATKEYTDDEGFESPFRVK